MSRSCPRSPPSRIMARPSTPSRRWPGREFVGDRGSGREEPGPRTPIPDPRARDSGTGDDPDIAILDRVPVILEQDRTVFAGLIPGAAGRQSDLGIIDRLDPVVDHGHAGLLDDLAL